MDTQENPAWCQVSGDPGQLLLESQETVLNRFVEQAMARMPCYNSSDEATVSGNNRGSSAQEL